MDAEQLVAIRRRLIYLTYEKDEDIRNYETLKKEQENLQTMFKDHPKVLRMQGIKPFCFGDLIMKDKDCSHKEVFFKCTRNEMIRTIELLIVEGV